MTRKLLAVAALSASALLTACANSPYAYDAQARNTMIGSTITGAAIGALSQSDDGNRKDIGKGAAIGAVVGAGTGYVMTH